MLHAVEDTRVSRARSSSCRSPVDRSPSEKRSNCAREDSSSRTSEVGETLGQSVSRRVLNSSVDVSSRSNQASSAPSRADERKARRASLTSRDFKASRPDLYGAGRATMDRTSSLTRSALSVARANRTRRLTSPSNGRRRPWRARRRSSPIRASPLIRRTSMGSTTRTLAFGGDVGDRGLHHGLLPEGGEHLRDVAQEGTAGAQHEHALPAESRVVVEEEGGPVEADRRLAGAGATLHRQQLVEGSADDLVLLRLDGGDDVEHLAGAGPLELGQQGIAPAQPGGPGIAVAAVEEVVGHRHHRVAVDHDLAAPGQTQRILRAGPVEGDGYRGPPVDDDGVGTSVLHVAAADVPGGPLLLVDPPEEERAGALGQECNALREGGHVVEVGVAGSDEVLEEALGSLPHGGEGIVGVPQVGLLSVELRVGERRMTTHRNHFPGISIANGCAQKSPDIPGNVLTFTRPFKASTCSFPFSSVRTLNL